MRFGFSILARERHFSRRLSRIRPLVESLKNEFESIQLHHPIHELLLISVTDEKAATFLQEFPNNEGAFQVMLGMGPPAAISSLTERELFELLYSQVRRGILACPFVDADHLKIEKLLEDWAVRTLPVV